MATFKQKVQLLRGLIDGKAAYTGPFYVDVDVTRRCNMHCLGCQYHSSKTRKSSLSDHALKDVSFELIEQLCEEFPRLDTHEVLLVGEGEPFLHPRLFDIIAAFKHAGLKVQLFTNGTLLNAANAEQLLDSKLDILRVSLWANSVEEYEKCYPGVNPGNLQKTLTGVKIVTDLKTKRRTTLPTVLLTEPLNRYNYTSINTRINLAHNIGCDGVAFDAYRHWQGEFSSASLSAEEIDVLCEDLAQAKKLLEPLSLVHNTDDILLQYRLGETAWHELPCYTGWFYTRIRVDGTVMPCGACPVPLGNLYESSFEEIWNGSKYRAFRRNMLTTEGPALDQYCDCDWCCFTKDGFRVHRLFRWFDLFSGRTV